MEILPTKLRHHTLACLTRGQKLRITSVSPHPCLLPESSGAERLQVSTGEFRLLQVSSPTRMDAGEHLHSYGSVGFDEEQRHTDHPEGRFRRARRGGLIPGGRSRLRFSWRDGLHAASVGGAGLMSARLLQHRPYPAAACQKIFASPQQTPGFADQRLPSCLHQALDQEGRQARSDQVPDLLTAAPRRNI